MSTDRLPLHHRLLVDCIHPDPAPEELRRRLAGTDAQTHASFIESAFLQGVHPLLYRRLKELKLLDTLDPLQKSLLTEGVMNYSLFLSHLSCNCREVLALFRDAGIDCIVLKGMHLSMLIYDNPADRMMSDLDLLVRQGDLLRAAELLAARGIAPHDYKPVEAETAHCHHLVPFTTNRGNSLEIHWTLKLGIPIDLDGLWERSVVEQAGGTALAVLSPEDFILHLCLNATVPDFEVKLRTLCDLYRTVTRYGSRLDWLVMIERAERWKVEKSLLLLLYATQTLFGLQLPGWLFERVDISGLREMERTMLQCMFSTQVQERNAVIMLMQLLRAGGLRAAASLAWNKVFYPKEVIASMYRQSGESSPAALYLLRTGKLLGRFSEALSHLMLRPVSKNKELLAFDRSVERMKTWLHQ